MPLGGARGQNIYNRGGAFVYFGHMSSSCISYFLIVVLAYKKNFIQQILEYFTTFLLYLSVKKTRY